MGSSELLIVLDRDGSTPLQQQVCDQITALLRAGQLRPGDSVPASRELAQQAGRADPGRGRRRGRSPGSTGVAPNRSVARPPRTVPPTASTPKTRNSSASVVPSPSMAGASTAPMYVRTR
ncbi:hypothetical protein ACFXKR_16360 [Streptomyces violascens]|uniref:hypothetical protein n=1 Tax=Streptomyces violascens TaxID=67381 RepID=UPI0036CA2626